MPVPPASGGRCGAHSPSARTSSRSSATSASASASSRFSSALVREHPLGHEGPHLLEPLRRGCQLRCRHLFSIVVRAPRLLHGICAAGDEPARARRARPRGRALRLRLGLGRGGVGNRRRHAARVARCDDRDAQARHGDHAAARPLAGEHGDDGGDARPALGRPLPAWARHVGAAGRRGLARPGVGEAARQAARVRRDRAFRASPRPARASRGALRHPGPRTAPGSGSRSS